MLASKLYEAGVFLCKEELLWVVPCSLQETRDKVATFYARSEVWILKFIRDKFTFHYDTWKDLDPKIDKAFRGFPEATMWLSEDDSGNEVFSSTNSVIMEVLYNEAKAQEAGFSGDKGAFLRSLLDMVLDGAEVVAKFGRGYISQCFPGTWEKEDCEEVEAVVGEEVVLPTVIARNEGS